MAIARPNPRDAPDTAIYSRCWWGCLCLGSGDVIVVMVDGWRRLMEETRPKMEEDVTTASH